jgi:hypothetical protein
MFARRHNEVIPKLRSGIAIKKYDSGVLTARQLIALDALLKGQKYNQEYFVQKIVPSLLSEKKRFYPRKP